MLRYREPVYQSVRELAMSYFHEYFLNSTGQKTLRSYSVPFNLAKYAHMNWLISQESLIDLIQLMADSPHYKIVTTSQIKNLRKADSIEIAAGKLVEVQNKKHR